MEDPTQEIARIILAGGGGAAVVGGFWAWLGKLAPGHAAVQRSRADVQRSHADVLTAATKLQEIMNNAVEKAAERMHADLEDVRQENVKLRERLDALEGQHRQSQQVVQSLQSILDKNGIDWRTAIEAGTLLVVEGENATVVSSQRRRKA